LLAKTDKLDAKIISEFGHVMDLDGSNVLSLTAEEIRELLKRREKLIADKRRELQRKDKVSITIKKSLERHIKRLESEINNVDNTLETIRKND
jgi:transposase